MKRLGPAHSARRWLVVALVGLVVVVLVLALRLIPRLTAGQDVLDAAKPAVTDDRVAGDRAGIDFISKYVDLADPLMTARGGAHREVPRLVRLVSKQTGLSSARVAAVLRREAPHTEALLRALPLSGVAREIPALTRFLATTLNISTEALAAELERTFPKLSQTLTALPSVTSGWNDFPGSEGLTRFDGTTPVRTAPALRDYFSADLVGTVERDKEDVQDLAGNGGVGYIPWLLLVVGVGLLAFGVVQARRAESAPAGRRAWWIVVAVGVVIVGLVVVLRYFPRLSGADDVVSDLQPAFTEQRVQGDRAGVDMVHQTVLLGDPIATVRGGAAAEVPELVTFVSQRTNLSPARVRAALRRQAPRTAALLEAIPLSAVSAEVPHLVAFLSRTLRISGDRLIARLRKRTPRLAQSILAVRPVTLGWNMIPGTERLTRVHDSEPVRTMTALDAYFGTDVIPVLETQREHFRQLADPWPPLRYFPPLLIVVGALLMLYGLVGVRGTRKAKG